MNTSGCGYCLGLAGGLRGYILGLQFVRRFTIDAVLYICVTTVLTAIKLLITLDTVIDNSFVISW